MIKDLQFQVKCNGLISKNVLKTRHRDLYVVYLKIGYNHDASSVALKISKAATSRHTPTGLYINVHSTGTFSVHSAQLLREQVPWLTHISKCMMLLNLLQSPEAPAVRERQ